MTTPIDGGGLPPDQPQSPGQAPQPFPAEESDTSEKIKINPELHPIAQWFIDHWGWSAKNALSAEKQFLKNIMQQCQHILNKYKNIYKKLNPENPDNQ